MLFWDSEPLPFGGQFLCQSSRQQKTTQESHSWVVHRTILTGAAAPFLVLRHLTYVQYPTMLLWGGPGSYNQPFVL